jgi:hypothetical protein
MGRPGVSAGPITDRRQRRFLGWELLVVLAIFPLASTLAALFGLVSRLYAGHDVAVGGVSIANEPIATLIFSAALSLTSCAAAGLVFYLLARSGEGRRSIGLGDRGLRTDLALVLPVWFLVQIIPQDIGSAIVRNTHLPTYFPLSPSEPAGVLLGLGLVTALVSGFVEEIVVLGFLIRRLEQRGWAPAIIVVLAVAVRVSYHLYYGPGVLPIVLWATASVLLYRRIRRLLPFIICHIWWDARIAIAHSSLATANFLGLVFLLAGIVASAKWWRWEGATPGPASGDPMGSPLWA